MCFYIVLVGSKTKICRFSKVKLKVSVAPMGKVSIRKKVAWVYHFWYTLCVSQVQKVITATFYRLPSGKEPVRDWLLELPDADRKVIGGDLMAVEFGWPCGEPFM